MINNEKEYVLCAAIWHNDEKVYPHQPVNVTQGIVICGMRHHNIFIPLNLAGLKDRNMDVQGFLTSKNRFVDREEASKIAYEAQQTDRYNNQLYSEDIY